MGEGFNLMVAHFLFQFVSQASLHVDRNLIVDIKSYDSKILVLFVVSFFLCVSDALCDTLVIPNRFIGKAVAMVVQ